MMDGTAKNELERCIGERSCSSSDRLIASGLYLIAAEIRKLRKAIEEKDE